MVEANALEGTSPELMHEVQTGDYQEGRESSFRDDLAAINRLSGGSRMILTEPYKANIRSGFP